MNLLAIPQSPVKSFGPKTLAFLLVIAAALTLVVLGMFRQAGIFAILSGLVIVAQWAQQPIHNFLIGLLGGTIIGMALAMLGITIGGGTLFLVSQAAEVPDLTIQTKLVIEFVATCALFSGFVHAMRKRPTMV